MLGLNFTHLDEGPLTHFTLDPLVMKTWGVYMWALFVFVVILLSSILYVIA